MMDFDSLWKKPPADLALGRDDVHVWRCWLDLTSARVQSLLHTLTPDERSRAERFYRRKDRDHFIVGRGVLRNILSYYLHVEPGQLRFCYNPYGKPALTGETGMDTLRFNVSHSHGLALYAFTQDREIGIDIEHIRPIPEAEQIVKRSFSALENAVFHALPTRLKHEAFFNCWTRKEAYIKARGEGLSLPLDQFDVSLTPGKTAKLLNIRCEPQEATRWSLQELMPGPGYVAALAVKGHGWQLKCWQWSDDDVSSAS